MKIAGTKAYIFLVLILINLGYDLDPQMIEEGEENFSNLIYKERRLKLTNDTFFNILTHSPDTVI